MATKKLSNPAKEGSTYIIIAQFFAKNSDGTVKIPITPNEGLTWSLKDEDGTIINDRSAEPVTADTTVTIALKGADLALSGDYPEERFVQFDGTFDSEYGNSLPIRDQISFQIVNLV